VLFVQVWVPALYMSTFISTDTTPDGNSGQYSAKTSSV
jgi:hypothetical protein